MHRNKLSMRTVTHVAQEDNRHPEQKAAVALEFLDDLKHCTLGIKATEIYNMDETPVYIDMMSSRTISFQGEKSVEVTGTGHAKTRFTVVLLVSASGRVFKSMVIIKGRKTVPKVPIPANMIVVTSHGGSMNEPLMLQWIDHCLASTGRCLFPKKGLLILDEHGSHKHESVKEKAKQMKVDLIFVPPKMTSLFQPLDVGINAPFKIDLKDSWENWMSHGEKKFTKAGNRCRPSWETIFRWVDKATKAIKPDSIQRAFECCGIAENGAEVVQEQLNSRLRNVLQALPDQVA